MKFVNMHKGLVWFPAVGTFIITTPSNKELHDGSLMMITTMPDNLVNYELLFVLLSNINWIDTMRIKTRDVLIKYAVPNEGNTAKS